MRLFALLLALTLLPATARADLKKAAAHYEKGTRLYQVGEYGRALDEFKAGYVEEADPSFLFNTAQCYWRLGQEKEALLGYRRFLAGAPDTPMRADVERKIRELEQALERKAAAPRPAPVALTASRPPPPPRAGPSRWPVWVTGLATVALAGGAAAMGVTTNERFRSLRDSCGRTAAGCADDQVNEIRTRAVLANVLWGLAGAAAIGTGIALYATAGPSAEGSVTVALRF